MVAPEEKKRITFDPTINLGHVLTAMTMLGLGASAYSILSTRVAVLEDRATYIASRTVEQASEQKEQIKEIRIDLKDVQKSVNDISRALAGKRLQ